MEFSNFEDVPPLKMGRSPLYMSCLLKTFICFSKFIWINKKLGLRIEVISPFLMIEYILDFHKQQAKLML
ncbi:hypothetical protein C5T94_17950 [Raoultella ornithinolytica]|nr:hypothetical protein C5T92_16945 [Raoultella ornithinolytica]PQH36165.1 hypothetical protein C5T94_17950 [Raoultella ornithinolytica]